MVYDSQSSVRCRASAQAGCDAETAVRASDRDPAAKAPVARCGAPWCSQTWAHHGATSASATGQFFGCAALGAVSVAAAGSGAGVPTGGPSLL